MRIVFDLDGTLSDQSHRQHLVHRDRKHPLWDEFYRQCVHDKPIDPVIEIFRTLLWSGEHDIRIWSARKEFVRSGTVGWILYWVTAEAVRYMDPMILRLRPDDNSEPDDALKESWLDQSIAAGWKPDLIFDDRNKVVAMWRRRGIPCFQVAEGNF